jgi:hypothetical protein
MAPKFEILFSRQNLKIDVFVFFQRTKTITTFASSDADHVESSGNMDRDDPAPLAPTWFASQAAPISQCQNQHNCLPDIEYVDADSDPVFEITFSEPLVDGSIFLTTSATQASLDSHQINTSIMEGDGFVTRIQLSSSTSSCSILLAQTAIADDLVDLEEWIEDVNSGFIGFS